MILETVDLDNSIAAIGQDPMDFMEALFPICRRGFCFDYQPIFRIYIV